MSESNDWQVPGSGSEIYETVFVPAMMAEWALRLIALAGPQPGEHILDVGCGTGALTRPAAKSTVPKGRIVGLDRSPEMLAVARALDSSSAAPIEWREGDVSDMPFESGTFDIVFCAFSLMFFPDRLAALKEMRRVLKPDGRLAISVWGSINKCPGQTVMKERWERYFGPDQATGFTYMHILSDPEMVRSLVYDAGFRNISVEPTMGVVRHLSPEYLVRNYGAMMGTPTDEQTRTKVIQEVSAALRPYARAEGLEYPIEALLALARK